MDNTLKEDIDLSFLRVSPQKRESIASDWNVDNARKSSKLVIAMKHLHLIAKRGIRAMKASEDNSDQKLVINSPKHEA